VYLTLNIRMKGENNIFLRNIDTIPVPWQHKVINAGPHRQDVIADYEGNHICTLEPTSENFRPDQYRRTYALISHAPLLLAALTEYALEQDIAGKLTPQLAELLRDAGGVDIVYKTVPPEPEPVVEPKPEPKTWDNTAQRSKPQRPLDNNQ